MSKQIAHTLILASGSPRRRSLLCEAGYAFEVVQPPLEEPVGLMSNHVVAAAWAEALAYYKARAVAERYPDAVVIGADTIVVHGEHIIGKPADEAEARRILSTQFGGSNVVITGLTVMCFSSHKRVITHDSTTIDMRPMEPSELEDYLASGAWRDKAGAYALQEGGDRFVRSMVGSESNVVGLPLELLRDVFDRFLNRDGY